MKNRVLLAAVISIMLCMQNSFAVKIFECIDEDGDSVFQDRCPPGTTPKSEMKYGTSLPETESDSERKISVILYYIPQCQGCNQVRQFFSNRNITIVEKNVENNIELQDELKNKVGNLSVPTVDINGEYVTGFNEAALLNITNKNN